MKSPRLIPTVMFAAACLFGLKVAGLLDGDILNTVANAQTATSEETAAVPAEAQDTQGTSGAATLDTGLITDEVPELPPGILPPENRGYITQGVVPEDQDRAVLRSLSPSEQQLLERLGERREELEAREAALIDREALIGAAEKRLETRIAELQALEARIAGLLEERDEKERAQVAGLVTMYENMKPKDAARIFDRLQLEVLLSVVEQMKPRVMSAILAEMQPQNAERLTMAIASKNKPDSRKDAAVGPGELPNIDG